MDYEITELNWPTADEDAAEHDGVLDEHELSRLQYLAEHPELNDPLIRSIPITKFRSWGGRR